jgi:glyoxylase-like metal-dependent hydrolase (beta-lactamase superfamily II)
MIKPYRFFIYGCVFCLIFGILFFLFFSKKITLKAILHPVISSPLIDMPLIKLSPHIYYVQGLRAIGNKNKGFISNAAVIITSKGVVVFDALGTPSLGKLLIEKIKTITHHPIVKVIVSHYHADHIYGLSAFKSLGAEIIAPKGYEHYLNAPIAQQRLQERQQSLAPWVNKETRLIAPDTVIDKNTPFSLGDVEFEIHFLGQAHSDGDLTLLVKTDNVLLSGDLIFEGRIPFLGNAKIEHWLSLLEDLKQKPLQFILPGHGGVASTPNKTIELTLTYLKTLHTHMKKAVDEMLSFDDAYNTADWSEFETLPAFKEAHRKNVFSVFLSLEQASME